MGDIRKLIFCLTVLTTLHCAAQEQVNSIDSVALVMQSDTAAEWKLPDLFSAYDSTYSFIQFNSDTLVFGSDSSTMIKFFERLENVIDSKKGNVHIMHIGGSHVQAGTMSNRIRRHFLAEYGEEPASRGFIFPYSAANACNNPRDYTVTRSAPFSLIRNVYSYYPSPLGLCGISVYCTQELHSIKIKMNDPDYDFATDTVVVFGRSNGNYIDPILKEDTIYHFADETDLEKGRYYFYFQHPVNDFTLYFPCGNADTFFLNGILLKNGKPGITFSSIGVNGASVPSYLRCENFERDMQTLPPDLVIFGIGVNDAFATDFDPDVFYSNYIKLVKRIRNVNPDCAFIFLTNNDTWKRGKKGRYHVNQNSPLVCETMHKLAEKCSGAVWDQFEVMGGLGSMARWQDKNLAQKDRVHFTVNGYNLVGDLFYHAFIQSFNSLKQ